MAASGCPASTGRARPRSHALRCHRAPTYPPALAVSGARRRRQRRAATLLAPSWGQVSPPRIGSPAWPEGSARSRRGPAGRFQPPLERMARDQDALPQPDVRNFAAIERRVKASAADVVFANEHMGFIDAESRILYLFVHLVLFALAFPLFVCHNPNRDNPIMTYPNRRSQEEIMPAIPKEPGTPTVTQAVRQLRIKLGDTQQEFAQRLGLAISTVVRYESTRPPRPGVLKRYYALAVENNLYDVAAMFQEAIVGQVAIAPSLLKLGALASHTIPGAHADLAVLLNHLEYGSGTAEEKIIEAISRLKRVLPEIEKLNLYLPKPAPETLQKDLSISGQGTVRRDVLHLPGGGTRLIEVTVTDGSPPAASEEPQGTAEGEERSAPK